MTRRLKIVSVIDGLADWFYQPTSLTHLYQFQYIVIDSCFQCMICFVRSHSMVKYKTGIS